MTKQDLKQLIKEVISEMSVNENYEDSIKDTKDRMAYLALRKQEKDYISKSKQSSSPIKKQHYMDMSKQVLDKALDILKKHKVVDESSTNENWKDNLKVGSAVGLMAAAGPIAGKLAPNVNVDGKVYKMTSRMPDNVKPQKVKTDDGKEVYIWQEPATGRHSHGQTNNLYVPVKQTNEAFVPFSTAPVAAALVAAKNQQDVDALKKAGHTNYNTSKGYNDAKSRLKALKDELKRIQKFKSSAHYNDEHDAQTRNYHIRRLKEIPKEISKIRQKVLGLKQEANTKELQKLGFTPTKSDVNEVKGYVLSPMDQASTWIAWNKKPKNKNGKQMWVVSAADFQKQFPSIQMKELPAKPSSGADYYIIDSEGDLFPYSQANIGSGLD